MNESYNINLFVGLFFFVNVYQKYVEICVNKKVCYGEQDISEIFFMIFYFFIMFINLLYIYFF